MSWAFYLWSDPNKIIFFLAFSIWKTSKHIPASSVGPGVAAGGSRGWEIGCTHWEESNRSTPGCFFWHFPCSSSWQMFYIHVKPPPKAGRDGIWVFSVQNALWSGWRRGWGTTSAQHLWILHQGQNTIHCYQPKSLCKGRRNKMNQFAFTL